MSAIEKIYFYPVWLRIWHGLNALGIITLIITGVSMQSSIESAQLVGFNMIINIHNIAGIAVALSYFVYFIGNMVTPNGKYYIIKPQGFLKETNEAGYLLCLGNVSWHEGAFPNFRETKI